MIDENIVEFVDGAIDDVREFINEKISSINLPRGEKGERGERGPAGERSEKGERGERGPAGERGEKGERGPQGDKGDSIVGPEGPRGEKGNPGERGEKGADGIGIIGPMGPKGEKGDPGERGPQGERGEQGAHGKDGRDALQIDILPSVDPEKEYPRGTFAQWDGGLIRAYRQTIQQTKEPDMMKAGWDVVVAGWPVLQVKLGEDQRTLMMVTRKTGEAESISAAVLPVMIYRGIYAADTEYQQGDTVTWGGSTWHCQKTTKSAPRENTDDWKLMVKEGRPGKPGKDGERGPQGPAGKDRDLTQMGLDGKKW